jgi:hypothetical protein
MTGIANRHKRGTPMPVFDTQRAHAIAEQLREQLDDHATLLSRTEDPVFQQLIGISRQWWVEWLASGLHDIARDKECDALEMAFQDRLAVLEAAMVEAGGMESFDRFVTWAQSEMPEFVFSFVLY